MKINNLRNQGNIHKAKNKKIKKEIELHRPDEVQLSGTEPGPLQIPGSKLPQVLKHQALKGMSKVDLHRHLEGSFTPEMIINIAKKYDIVLPSRDLESLRPFFQITEKDKTLVDFLQKFKHIGKLFKNKAAVKDLTYQVIQNANRDNVKYLELRFSPFSMAGYKKDDGEQLDVKKDVMEGVFEGVKEASESFDTKVNLIMIASRKRGLKGAMDVLELAKDYKDRGISSVDIAGDEFHFPPEEFTPFFLEAEKEGFYRTGHGSEALGPESADILKNKAHVQRIGHGVRIYQDSKVENQAAGEKWVLELCPTSNEQTGAVEKLDKEHYPLDRYDKKGLKVTINTDDPGVSGIDLTGETELIMDLYDYPLEKMMKFNLQALDAAFLPEEEREHLKEKFMRNYQEMEKTVQKRLDLREGLKGK